MFKYNIQLVNKLVLFNNKGDNMKWPEYLMLIRHLKTTYNALKEEKLNDSEYKKLVSLYESCPESEETIKLANKLKNRFSLGVSDSETPIIDSEKEKAVMTGKALKEQFELPDVIFVSPYLRTTQTLEALKIGWPELESVTVFEDERIRELEHGITTLYNDWRIYFILNPEDRLLQLQDGKYRYRYPRGENVPDVRTRNSLWVGTLIREFAEKRVLAVTHHLTILSIRAQLERLTVNDFIHLDENEKPINCGVTFYRGSYRAGKDGQLKKEFYNKKFF